MATLSDFVEVTIQRDQASVTQAGFGTALFLLEFAERGTQTAAVASYGPNDYQTVFSANTAAPALGALNAYFSQSISPRTALVAFKSTASETSAAAFTRISNLNNEWYALATTDVTQANQVALATAIEATGKIAIFRTAGSGVVDSTETDDLASTLQTANRARSAVLYTTGAATEYADAAWLGRMLPTNPGSGTWFAKTLSGVTPDTIPASQTTILSNKNANSYQSVNGRGVTLGANFANGAYIDLQRGSDWITSRMQERVFTDLLNEDKVPYTSEGGELLANTVRGVLGDAVAAGVLVNDPAPVVTLANIDDIPIENRRNRILPLTFTGTFAGAIHGVRISGRIVT